jgi:hypothetical protein
MKEIIRQILKEERSLKSKLTSMVKQYGLKKTSQLIGIDVKSINRIAFNGNPNDYIKIFDDLEMVPSEVKPEWILFRRKPGKNLMVYDTVSNILYVDWDEIWNILSRVYKLDWQKQSVVGDFFISKTGIKARFVDNFKEKTFQYPSMATVK